MGLLKVYILLFIALSYVTKIVISFVLSIPNFVLSTVILLLLALLLPITAYTIAL